MIKKYILHPAEFKLDGGAMFGIIPRPLWQKKITPDEQNRILMSLRVMFIETDERKILVDTGIGDYHPEKFVGQFDVRSEDSPLENILLQELNIKASEITDIVLTHLHFDHVGGLGKGENGDELIFENATVHVHAKHLEYSQNCTLRDAGSFQTNYFLPLIEKYRKKGQLNLVDELYGDLFELTDGKIAKYKISFGHTPYMLHPIFDDVIYMADLVPMSYHVHVPWVMGYDIEPGVTTKYKQEFYKYIIDNDLTVVFEHDKDIWGGKISQNEKGKFILEELKDGADKKAYQILS